MATPKAPKTLLDLELEPSKETKGTIVLANADAGLSIYVPKPFFAAAGIKAEGAKFRISITELA